MNILIVGNFYTEAFGQHVAETLEDMQHTVFRFEPGIKFKHNSVFGKRWNTIRQSIYNEILIKVNTFDTFEKRPLFKIVKENEIDLTIVLKDYLNPKQLSLLKNYTSAPVILWFPDAIINFNRSMFLIAGYDALFFHDKYIVKELVSNYNLNTYYLPQGCYPKYHYKIKMTSNDNKIYGCDISNVGNMYPARIALFNQLTKYNIKIWGNLPPIWADNKKINLMLQGKYVRLEEKIKAFNGAKIVLNNLHPAEINGVNKRTFEATGCGAFLMVNYRPALEELYDIGKEVVAYHNFDDMIEKIDYYLTHEEERQKIAEAGYKRTHKDHTLEKRLNKLFKIVFK